METRPGLTNREAAERIVRRLHGAGHVAYLAGGCVRDQLLGLTPKDHDVATSATPGDVRGLFRNTQAVGAAFGVMLVRVDSQQVEVATFRTDGTYSDGRRPESVKFATPELDARRRDFTINGLFYDIERGEVIDFVGGQADLASRTLRAIGVPAQRFAEDYLRLLRAARFAARFDLAVDPATAAAIVDNARHLRQISPERVGDEVRRMLRTPKPARDRAFELLRRLHLLPELLRFVDAPDVHHLNLFGHLGEECPLSAALAAMVLDECCDAPVEDGVRLLLGAEKVAAATAGLRQALRLSNDETEAVEATLLALGPMVADEEPRLSAKRRLLASPVAEGVIAILRGLASAGLFVGRLGTLLPELAELSTQDNAPPPLLTGDDLVRAGLRPGPVFKRLLDATYDEQLEGRVVDAEGARAFALRQAADQKQVQK